MHSSNFEGTIEKMIQKDPRYSREAYLFVREALDYTQKRVEKKSKEEIRHVSGQELLSGIRSFALEHFGPMAQMVLNEWGVLTCQDFGEIVFNMVESNLLAKTAQDTREDFKGGYDFFEAFRRPFLPTTQPTALPEAEPKSTRV
jgi:uncharacterized repeat protein (TIGR04138 family)